MSRHFPKAKNGFMILSLVLLTSCPLFAHAQSKPGAKKPASMKPKAPPPDADPYRVQDTPRFFDDFDAKHSDIRKDQFETEEEHSKRIAWTKGKTVYFRVDAPFAYVPKYPSGYEFKYDIVGEKLTLLFGIEQALGREVMRELNRNKPSESALWLLTSERAAKNEYGGKKRNMFDVGYGYVIRLSNTTSMPMDLIDASAILDGQVRKTHYHRLSVVVDLPRDEARYLSKEAEILIGVEPKGYAFADSVSVSNDFELKWIDADLREVIVRDKKTRRVHKAIKIGDVPIHDPATLTTSTGRTLGKLDESYAPPARTKWEEVTRFSGSTSKNTDPFTITAKRWRIRWTLKSDDSQTLLGVTLKSGEGKYEGSLGPIEKAGSDLSNFYESGTFFLDIIATDEYELIVEEMSE